MVNPHLEKIFFHNIIRNQHYVDVGNSRFFEEPTIKQLFPIVKEFWNRYKECPTLAQVREIVKVKGIEQEVTNSHLERLWEIDMGEFEHRWLKENTETFIEYKNLEISAIDLGGYLQTTKINTGNIKNVVQTAKNIILDRNNIDFEFKEGSDFFTPSCHRQPIYNTFSSGYPFIDTISDGGFSAKTLTVLLGQAKVGKCQTGERYITIRNKKKGIIQKIKIGEFHEQQINRRNKR